MHLKLHNLNPILLYFLHQQHLYFLFHHFHQHRHLPQKHIKNHSQKIEHHQNILDQLFQQLVMLQLLQMLQKFLLQILQYFLLQMDYQLLQHHHQLKLTMKIVSFHRLNLYQISIQCFLFPQHQSSLQFQLQNL